MATYGVAETQAMRAGVYDGSSQWGPSLAEVLYAFLAGRYVLMAGDDGRQFANALYSDLLAKGLIVE